MIDNTGRAVLADFSRIAFISDHSAFLSSWADADAVRWMSPELLNPGKSNLSKRHQTRESDCYALGMVVYEVLGGCAPFGTDGPISILRKILDGERPERPQGEVGKLLTDKIWDVLKRCWKTKPRERASAKSVLRYLEGSSLVEDEEDNQSDDTSTDSLDESNHGMVSPSDPRLATSHSHRWGETDPPVTPHKSGLLVLPLDSGEPPSPVIPGHYSVHPECLV